MIYPTGGLLPEFAASATNIAQPTSDKRAAGWGTNEAPPSSYFNWLHRTSYDWLRYLSYEWKLQEDFIRPNSVIYAPFVGGTATAPSGTFGPCFVTENAWSQNSRAVLLGTGVGTCYIESPFPYLFTADDPVRMDMIIDTSRAGAQRASGSFQAFGIKNTAEFIATGVSSASFPGHFWSFQWKPSFTFNPTAIPLGATFFQGRAEWDYRQPTMIVSWWPLGFISPTSFAFSCLLDDDSERVSIRQWSASGENGILSVDRVAVGIKHGLRDR